MKTMIKAYQSAKIIHRLFLYVTAFLIVVMGGSGVVMKYPDIRIFAVFDPGLIRSLHNDMSIYFVISLTIMMLTGIYMYLFPLMRRRD